LSPNCVAHMAGVQGAMNRQEFEAFGSSFYSAFDRGQHQFDEIIATGDRVVTSGTFTATHLGAFQGLPATGQRICISVMHIDRVENGAIVEHWGQGNALGLMQQLGMLVIPGPKLLTRGFKSAISKLFSSSKVDTRS
ncbi:MAG: ester cyclase, partial [Cyanobacteria bacterium P01_G01_bin.4]